MAMKKTGFLPDIATHKQIIRLKNNRYLIQKDLYESTGHIPSGSIN